MTMMRSFVVSLFAVVAAFCLGIGTVQVLHQHDIIAPTLRSRKLGSAVAPIHQPNTTTSTTTTTTIGDNGNRNATKHGKHCPALPVNPTNITCGPVFIIAGMMKCGT